MKPDFNTDDNNIRFIIESAFAKMEKANFRQWVIIIFLIVALIATNAGWIWWESQWSYTTSATQTITQDSQEGSNTYEGDFIGGDYNGKTDGN